MDRLTLDEILRARRMLESSQPPQDHVKAYKAADPQRWRMIELQMIAQNAADEWFDNMRR